MNECAEPKKFNVDCDGNAVCVDTDQGFSCRCRPGFADISEVFNRLPGRRCVEAVNECLDAKANDCSEHAVCEDAKEGYICSCKPGFLDASANSTHYPGRVCVKPGEQLDLQPNFSVDACDVANPQCGENEVCSDAKHGAFVCDCAEGYFRHTDRSCRLLSACKTLHSCDKNAICADSLGKFDCQCRPGFFDASPDPEKEPGRRCKPRECPPRPPAPSGTFSGERVRGERARLLALRAVPGRHRRLRLCLHRRIRGHVVTVRTAARKEVQQW